MSQSYVVFGAYGGIGSTLSRRLAKKGAKLLLAGRERIVDNARTRVYFERISTADKRCLEYPDAGHTLEFEPDPTRYLADLQAWCARVLRRR